MTDVSYFRCALTGWAPKGVLVASEELFKSEYAERRLIPIFIRPVGGVDGRRARGRSREP